MTATRTVSSISTTLNASATLTELEAPPLIGPEPSMIVMTTAPLTSTISSALQIPTEAVKVLNQAGSPETRSQLCLPEVAPQKILSIAYWLTFKNWNERDSVSVHVNRFDCAGNLIT